MKKIGFLALVSVPAMLDSSMIGCADYSSDPAGTTTTSDSTSSGTSTTGTDSTTSGDSTSGGTSTTGDSTSGDSTSGGTSTTGADSTTGGASTTGGSSTTGGMPSNGPLPCDVLGDAGLPCVSAHSTVRVIVSDYSGPLYQVCKGNAVAGPNSCNGETQDIGAVDGYADAASQDAFCAGGQCTITTIYDQSGQGNHLEPAPSGGAKPSPDNPAAATALPTTINGHSVYGILIRPGAGYRTGCNGCNIKTGNGIAVDDEPQTMYMVSSQQDLINGCCFDYGNAETTSNDDGNGTMEAVYVGLGVIWGTGSGDGPWVMADLENGLYAGWENGQDQNISTNTSLKHDFITAVVVGDTADKNDGQGRFAVYGGDAQAGELTVMYDGIRPEKPGYVPMHKQGSIILGTGGDNSNAGGGHFYEGVVANGVAAKETVDALQAAIVAAGYGN